MWDTKEIQQSLEEKRQRIDELEGYL